MAVTVNGSGPIAGATTLNGLTIPTASFGKILQVQFAQTNTYVSQTAAAYISTGLSATITPTSATSKILVVVFQNGLRKWYTDTYMAIKLARGATDLTYLGVTIGYTGSTATNTVGGAGTVWLDSPATTSAVTYQTLFSNVTGTGTVVCQTDSAGSTMALLEVAA